MPRLEFAVTEQQYNALKELTRVGIHGATPEHVAIHLLINEIERLVLAGVLRGVIKGDDEL